MDAQFHAHEIKQIRQILKVYVVVREEEMTYLTYVFILIISMY